MLFRECRFRTAAQLFREAEPSIADDRIFQILGGIHMQLYRMKVGNLPFYMVEGCCPTLVFDTFFEYFGMKYIQVTLEELRGNFRPGDCYYVIPVCSILFKEKREGQAEDAMAASLLGHSYVILREIDWDNDWMVVEGADAGKGERQGTEISRYQNILQSNLSDTYDLRIYCIDRKHLKENRRLQECMAWDRQELIVNNLKDALKDEYSPLDQVTLKGEQVYGILETHLRELLALHQSNKENKNMNKYIRSQMMYLRFGMTAGSDSFYREEFLDSLEKAMGTKQEPQRQILEQWRKLCSVWRQLGRKLGTLHESITEKKLEEVICFMEKIRKEEPELMRRTAEIMAGSKGYG